MKKSNKSPNHNAIVAKDNSLIGELAKFELSELRLLAFCLAHFDSRSPDNPVTVARVHDLTTIFPSMDAKSAYAVVRRAMLGINKKPFETTGDDGAQHFINWLDGFSYRPKTGEFSFYVTERMRPYLLGLKDSFTQYRLKDVYQFRSSTTWKLYENLAQWRSARRWSADLDEIRARLGVAGKYPNWYVFNRDVIKPSIEEINKFSDLKIEYFQEKRGRQVVGLVFQINAKSDDEAVINLEPPEDELHRRLLECGINARTAGEYSININRQGQSHKILAKLDSIVERAKKSGVANQKYILGAIRKELRQQNLFDEPQSDQISQVFPEPLSLSRSTPEPDVDPEYKLSLDCWLGFRRQREKCQFRREGMPPEDEKCQVCFQKLPVSLFGE